MLVNKCCPINFYDMLTFKIARDGICILYKVGSKERGSNICRCKSLEGIRAEWRFIEPLLPVLGSILEQANPVSEDKNWELQVGFLASNASA